jgi:hypothetical protein
LDKNGAKKKTKRNRRSNRQSGPRIPAIVRDGKAFSTADYLLVRHYLLARTEQRTWQPERDAALLALEFSGLRPEEGVAELWGWVTFASKQAAGVIRVYDALSHGELGLTKTDTPPLDPSPLYLVLSDHLKHWKKVAAAHGIPTGPYDPVIPGRAEWGGFTHNQHKKWGAKYLSAACLAASKHPGFEHLAHAKPYSARRGYISCRLAGGDHPNTVASDTRTSTPVIHQHYNYDVSRGQPGPLPPFAEQLPSAQTELARILASK